jgi:hypothetical protein
MKSVVRKRYSPEELNFLMACVYEKLPYNEILRYLPERKNIHALANRASRLNMVCSRDRDIELPEEAKIYNNLIALLQEKPETYTTFRATYNEVMSHVDEWTTFTVAVNKLRGISDTREIVQKIEMIPSVINFFNFFIEQKNESEKSTPSKKVINNEFIEPLPSFKDIFNSHIGTNSKLPEFKNRFKTNTSKLTCYEPRIFQLLNNSTSKQIGTSSDVEIPAKYGIE